MDQGTEGMRYFTKKELKEFDGKDGRLAYIAFQGKIYDVSNSKLWKNGIHAGRHAAGEELTQVMINAPHGEEVLTNLPLVGQLSQQTFEERIVRRIENFHFHPILVHFSIAYSIGYSLFSMLYFFTGEGSFETASFYLLFWHFFPPRQPDFRGFSVGKSLTREG